MTTMYFKSTTRPNRTTIPSVLLMILLAGFIFTVGSSNNQQPAHAASENDIMGTSQLTGTQLAQYFRHKKGSQWSQYMNIGLDALANLYVSEGALEGVRGDVAFAQAIHETGWFWSFSANCAQKNNYSGIGSSGACSTTAYHFATPQEGVRAQIHQLRNYADTTSVTRFTNLPKNSRDTFVYKGQSKTWTSLNGRWAYPGTTYGQTILARYTEMLNYFGMRGYCADASPIDQQVSGTGYWTVTSAGTVNAYGSAGQYGGMDGHHLNGHILGMARTGTNNGYWLVGSDGGIFSFGDAQFYGSTGSLKLNKPIVGMASTPSGRGYWLVASDGGIFSFGDAQFYGSTGSLKLNKPIVGMAPTPNGRGYWLVASDGGIFSFGNAKFYGSTGSIKLNQPIVGMAARPQSDGYWLVASDGGIFSFGNAKFKGSVASCGGRLVNGIQPTPSGNGYLVSSSEGRVTAFGDARHFGWTSASQVMNLAARQ